TPPPHRQLRLPFLSALPTFAIAVGWACVTVPSWHSLTDLSPLMQSSPVPAMTPGLMVIHSNHPEALRDLVVAWMQRYPLRPLESETILVQSNGIAQWL